MASDLAMQDEQLKEYEDKISDCLRAMEKLQGDQWLDKKSKADALLKQLNKVFHQFKTELRMAEGKEQEVYEKRSAFHTTTIGKLKEDIAKARSTESSSPNQATANQPNSPNGPRGDGKDEARQATKRIDNIQNATLAALTRAEGTGSDIENIGNDALGQLGKQREQIIGINEKLDQLDSQVGRAKQELNAFIRRMMTDKIIMCFALLALIGIIAIVVLRVKFPSSVGAPLPNADTTAPSTQAPQSTLTPPVPTNAPTPVPIQSTAPPPTTSMPTTVPTAAPL